MLVMLSARKQELVRGFISSTLRSDELRELFGVPLLEYRRDARFPEQPILYVVSRESRGRYFGIHNDVKMQQFRDLYPECFMQPDSEAVFEYMCLVEATWNIRMSNV